MVKSVFCSIMYSFVLLYSATAFIFEDCSSSCGQINISQPFRFKGDPKNCGDSNYEISCDGNHTTLNLASGEYYVTDISFNPNKFRIVDTGLTTGECHLSLGSISPRVMEKDGRYKLTLSTWASFVNCTSVISYGTYRPVPCLGLYLVAGHEVKDLKPSRGFVAMIPTTGFANDSSNIDTFQLMRTGFTVSWISPPSTFGCCFVR